MDSNTTSSTKVEARGDSSSITHELIENETQEALSSENMYFTFLEVGHQPTEEEALRHYGLNVTKEHAQELV